MYTYMYATYSELKRGHVRMKHLDPEHITAG